MKLDSALRKQNRVAIRKESLHDTNPQKQASVMKRLNTNQEIIDANVRQAARRAEENMRKIDEDIKKTLMLSS